MLLCSNLVFLTILSFTSYLAGSGETYALFSSEENKYNRTGLTVLIMNVPFIFCLRIYWRPCFNMLQIDFI